jgi:two-component system chemotaxis sensor kinase CheA
MSKDPFRYFRIEARELVDALQRGVIALGSPPEPEQVRALMRASHTLKGAAGVVRQSEIARLAHELEDKLAAKQSTDALLPLLDAISRELAALGAPPPPVANAPVVSESVRLDLAEVDDLLASLAELGARIATMRGKTGAELDATIEGVERLAKGALEDARRLRLLPAETLFAEIARAAHDAAARAGRLVEVTTSGGDKRIDAQVLGVVRDALLQLVRNAIAHGIEPPGERAAAGKPKAGQIAIRVDVRGPRAIIVCRDDGAGLDLEAFRAKLGPQAKDLDPTELVSAAMRIGVTTRASASELAGRGIGLQVVGAAITRLRGNLVVETARGAGTEIALDVPVSITAAPALVVETREQTVTIPLDAIARTVRAPASTIVRTPEGDALVDEDDTFRFASLARLLDPSAIDQTNVWTALIVDDVAIGVERVLGIANEVVHPLPPNAVSAPIVSGASLDGDGHPRLALDPRLLAEHVKTMRGAPAKPVSKAKPRVLVCDDSLTSRMLEQSILEAAGYEVTTATSGEEALEKARLHDFSLFVVDVEMTGMTGFETVGRMRADPALSKIPAVLVTSRAAAEDRRRGLEAGARAYIVKGEFAQTEFLDTVRRLIG